MGKDEQVQYWIKTAEQDWLTAKDLLKLGRFLHTLFFFHLVIEKLLKAHWVRANVGDFPPRSHDLEYLYSNIDIELATEDVDELRALNYWNLEGRYPDYLNKINKQADKKYTLEKYEFIKRLRKCLLEKL
jgi:HEPN domain-containing protein